MHSSQRVYFHKFHKSNYLATINRKHSWGVNVLIPQHRARASFWHWAQISPAKLPTSQRSWLKDHFFYLVQGLEFEKVSISPKLSDKL